MGGYPNLPFQDAFQIVQHGRFVDLMVHPHSLNYRLELMNKKIDFNTMNASYSCLSFILLFREGEYAITSWNSTQTKKDN